MLEILKDKRVNKEVFDLFRHIDNVMVEEFSFNKIDIDIFSLAIFSHKKNSCIFQLYSATVPVTPIEIEIREFCKNKYISTGYKKPTKKKLSKELEDILLRGVILSIEYGDTRLLEDEEPSLSIHHILMAILENKETQVTKIFNKFDITLDSLEEIFINRENIVDSIDYDDSLDALNSVPKKQLGKLTNTETSSDLGILKNFCDDISTMVREEEINIFGRDKELELMFNILSRKNKNNVVLCGECGVGRTSIVYKLADRINKGLVPRNLIGKKVMSLSISNVIAGTKYRGEYEERMIQIIKTLKENKNIILFISELHTLVGAGNSTGGLDGAQMIKPALSSGDIQVIGTTTLSNYKKVIEADSTLNRKFQKIYVEEPTIEECVAIIKNTKKEYEDHHNVIIPDSIIETTIKLTKRYISDRTLPDSVFDVLDTTAASTNLEIKQNKTVLKLKEKIKEQQLVRQSLVSDQEFDEIPLLDKEIEKLKKKLDKTLEEEKIKEKLNKITITEDNINKTISLLGGVPINKIGVDETKSLVNLEKNLKNKVIGQEEAVRRISNAVIRGRVGFRRESGTITTVLLIGNSGCGKTLVAKKLAEEIFGSEENMIRIDMSEYMEAHSISKMIGSPHGYVNSDEGGVVTEKLKHNKFSVVLWDECEKAHPSVFNLLLQIFDEGFITDSKGYKVDCKNTINILTSNIGTKRASELGKSVGFTNDSEVVEEIKKQSILEKELKKQFAPEFINRLDDIIYFNSLTTENLKEIVKLEINKFKTVIENSNGKYSLKYEEDLIDFLLKQIDDKNKQFGARPINRLIEKYLATPLSLMVISGKFKEGYCFNISVNEVENSLEII